MRQTIHHTYRTSLSWLTTLCLLLGTMTLASAVMVATPSHAEAQSTPVNLNTATAKELTKLPGIGKVTAGRIVADRAANGPYPSVAALKRVKGVGNATIGKIQGMAVVGDVGGPADGTSPEVTETRQPAKTRKGNADIDLTTGKPATPPSSRPAGTPSRAKKSKGKAKPTHMVNINTATAAQLQSLSGIGKSKAAAIVADREKQGPFKTKGDITRVRGVGKGILRKIEARISVE